MGLPFSLLFPFPPPFPSLFPLLCFVLCCLLLPFPPFPSLFPHPVPVAVPVPPEVWVAPRAPFPGRHSRLERCSPAGVLPAARGRCPSARAALAAFRFPRRQSRFRPLRMEARVAQSAARLARQVRGRAGRDGTGWDGTAGHGMARHRTDRDSRGAPRGAGGGRAPGALARYRSPRSARSRVRVAGPRESGGSVWEGKAESRRAEALLGCSRLCRD